MLTNPLLSLNLLVDKITVRACNYFCVHNAAVHLDLVVCMATKSRCTAALCTCSGFLQKEPLSKLLLKIRFNLIFNVAT